MNNNIEIVSKELRKRVKNAVIDILELIEKEGKVSIKYEDLQWINPKEMRIYIFADLIQYNTIMNIIKIIKRHKLEITNMIFERWRGDIVINMEVTLRDGEINAE